ncbi:MAG: hypothetical protein HQL18_00525 [Candidatus Omnitrophica bacterium]|nr:hypothetical protein [Candidatus Omnitrophota bacterium]
MNRTAGERVKWPGAVILRDGLLFIVCFMLLTPDALAAGIVSQVQQQKQQQAQIMAQQYQQAVAQQQAQQIAEYQQAVAVQQAQMAAYQKAAVEYAAYKQAMQQAVVQHAAELQAAEQVKQMIAQKQAQQAAEVQQVQQAVAVKQMQNVLAYKQAQEVQGVVAEKAQADLNQQVGEYAAYLAKRKQALTGQAIAMKQTQTAQELAKYQAYQQAVVPQQQQVMQAKADADARRRLAQAQVQDTQFSGSGTVPRSPYLPSEEKTGPETVVEIQDLWSSLDRSSQAWGQIIDDETKILTVAEYIDRFRKLGIKIKRSPGEYAKLMDALGRNDPGFLDQPFLNALSSAAIMEYDFDNGKNKDELAKQLLGEKNFASNRKRVLGE